jgi:glycogen debranching enzyme
MIPVVQQPYPGAAIAPKATLQQEVHNIQNFLSGDYWNRITDEERAEYQRILQRLQEQAEHPLEPDIVLKPSGTNSFISWPPNGLPTARSTQAKAYGYFHYDTQLIDSFTINTQKKPLQVLTIHIKNGQNVQYIYTAPSLSISRNEVIIPTELDEFFEFRNQGNTEKTVSVEAGVTFKDIFQVRSHETIPAPQLAMSQKVIPKTNTIELSTLKRNPEKPEIEANPIRLKIIASSQLVQSKAKNGHLVFTWNVKIPPQSNTHGELRLLPHNTFYSFLDRDKKQFPDMTLPEIQVETDDSLSGRQMQHLNRMLQNTRQDLSTLLLKIPSKDRGHIYVIPSAGIPNYVAFFGRDAIITSLFLLPFQPEFAKQTLLALAEYQGKRSNPITEEEPGKILHELRYGEMTRLGYTPHNPYYGSLDATPLFIILYQAYLKRTEDAALAQQLRPSIKQAFQWLEGHTEAQSGLMKQRYLPQQSAGATGLKNIGWKDSDYALRLILGPDNKLQEPAYPVAVAEVQAYAHQAWLIGADLFPQEKKRYLQHADQLKESFNHYFWLHTQPWPAIAVDRNNQAVPAIASNGAQVLWSDLLSTEQLVGMEQRLQKPDLLSGWGIRTLSSLEPAFNPIAYHNGSIWPHDNAMIVLGARKHHLLSAVQEISDQVLAAAGMFPDNRLPELYAGLAKRSDAPMIVPYPDTCNPQAWASASSYAFLTALLGINVSPQGIQVSTSLLPTGVKALQITGIPITSNRFMDVRARRNATGKVELQFRTSSQKEWQLIGSNSTQFSQ